MANEVPLDDPAVGPVLRAVARRLRRCPALRGETQEDLEQELRSRALNAWGRYDPARGTLAAFAQRVLSRRAADMVREARARSRGPVPLQLSALDVAADGGPGGKGSEEQEGLRLDVAEALAALPPPLRELAEVLKEVGMSEAARRLGITRAAARGRLARLRAVLRGSGLG